MPGWLQVVASLNPLTYAIEANSVCLPVSRLESGQHGVKGPFCRYLLRDLSGGPGQPFCGAALALIQPLLKRRIA